MTLPIADVRILHLIPRLSGGGAERQLSYLAPELARLGHEIHIAYERDGPIKPMLPNVTTHLLKSRSSYDPYLLWQFVRLVTAIKPDVINTWIIQSDVIGAIAAKLSGTPWILREPGSALGHPPGFKNWLRVRAASGASAIVANSFGGEKYWEKQLPKSDRRIVPNGLPTNEILGAVSGIPSGILKPDVPLILYAGRLAADSSATKNLKPLMHSLACVKREREIYAIICGEGPERTELQHLRHELDLDSDVHFTGYMPASIVWALMKEASVFVSLSAHEGAPNTVLEAMTCGCPLVLSDIPAHRDILDQTEAFFVNPLDVKETANTIRRVLTDREGAMQRAKIAQRKTTEWSVEKMARQYEDIYESISTR